MREVCLKSGASPIRLGQVFSGHLKFSLSYQQNPAETVGLFSFIFHQTSTIIIRPTFLLILCSFSIFHRF